MNKTGLQFGAYEIETLLGPGGVTETYRAHKNGAGGQTVALKLLRADRGGGETRVSMIFKNLAFRNRHLEVPGIARILDVSLDPTTVFVVTELVEGLDMEGLFDAAAATGSVPPERVADIGRQAAAILATLHQRPVPIVHGALCPGNVLLNENGNVVLSDIGYSAALRNVTEFAADKWWYVAPELLQNRSAKTSPASDVYSLGAVLFFLLAGEAPLMADTVEDLLEELRGSPPEMVGAPSWLASAIAKMMERDPSRRISTAQEVIGLLTPPGTAPVIGIANSLSISADAGDQEDEDDDQDQDEEGDDDLPNLDLLDFDGADSQGLDLIPAHELSLDTSSLAPALAANNMSFANADSIHEPEWVDDPGGGSLGGMSTGVDDFLDLPSPNLTGVLSARRTGAREAMDLPEIGDMPARGPAKVIDLRIPTAPNAPQSRADQGIHDADGDRLAGPIDLDEVGVVDYSEDDEAEPLSPSGAFTPIELPRRAGSARAGGPTARRRGGLSLRALGAVFLTVIGGGVGAYRLMQSDPVVVPPPPSAADRVVRPIDKNAEKSAAEKEQAQEASLASAAGKLTVETTPRGATVWVDGIEQGATPITVTTNPGSHRLVITKPGFKMLREVANTTEGLTIKRSLPPANINFGGTVSLKVECKTEGVYPVFVDGRDTGLLCPIDNLMIPAGNRLVGLYVIPQNKIWSFEREIVEGAQNHRVIFSY